MKTNKKVIKNTYFAKIYDTKYHIQQEKYLYFL